MNSIYVVAVDGPAGAGKSSICKEAAKRLGILHLDTGATYRTLALGLLRKGVDINDDKAIEAQLDKIDVTIGFEDGRQIMYLDCEDVTGSIRTGEVSMAASVTSKNAKVRERLVALQRQTAERISMIVDGRDICTNVFPKTPYKFYITVSVEERARRRALQLKEMGVAFDEKTLQQEIEERDHNDMTRDISPLRVDPDAVVIDNTNITQEQAVELMLSYIGK